MQHKTVLLQEAVDGLKLSPDSVVFDATFGSGGHAREISKILDETGCYIGVDVDGTALDRKKIDNVTARVYLVNDNFVNLTTIIDSLEIKELDGIIADLGWRMEQFADGEKGLSFMYDGPLQMTFGQPEDYPFTAEDMVNDWEEHVLADILYGYAEERFARRIAKGIVEARKIERIKTTFKLVEIIEQSLPRVALKKRINPATKTFQALRIAVNEELSVLEKFISVGFNALKPEGRLAIISFHSIEDRVVKHMFREYKDSGVGELLTKKPIVPTEIETKENPRARSAKLRIIIKK